MLHIGEAGDKVEIQLCIQLNIQNVCLCSGKQFDAVSSQESWVFRDSQSTLTLIFPRKSSAVI